MDVLDDMSNSQVNLQSSAARETISSLISVALKTKGSYKEYTEYELDEQKARSAWVCSICGENTFEVDYDHIGSGYNHLGCELKSQEEIDEYIEDIDEQAYAQGRGSSFGGDTGTDADFNIPPGEEIDGAYTEEVKEWEEAVGYKEDDDIPEGLKRAKELAQEALEEGLRREKNSSQKKHEEKVFGHGPDGYSLEENKLSEEIVDNKDEKYIYESPDGGKTAYKRKFGSDKREKIDLKKIKKENK
jgi:hypothetical protein|tara:strand:+ start:416 stop:1150 length:735 start_codon:yes stop_codon:yes gene_type:complete